VIFDVLKNLYIPKIYKLIQTKKVHQNAPVLEYTVPRAKPEWPPKRN
jgi:hypothetical protein